MAEPQVALVTGAGQRRVGSHVAEALAERGYRVALHYRSSQLEAETFASSLNARGLVARPFGADLSDESQVRRLIADLLEAWGRIDVLVHCASTWSSKRLEEITADDVRGHFEANTMSTFLCCQQVGLVMTRQATGGCIITLGDWAIERPYRNYAAYFPSKGAIPALTRSMAVELGIRNPRVRVNCILPGPVLLPPDLPDAERDEAIAGTLVRREGNPRHIALAALHFVDNDFITGACLPVDGGRTIYAPDS